MKSALWFAAGAVIASSGWIFAQSRTSPSRPSEGKVLQVRFAQLDELSAAKAKTDPIGSKWAEQYNQNFPAKMARECGVARFTVETASDFFQAVRIPLDRADEKLFQCLRTKGGESLRYAIVEANH